MDEKQPLSDEQIVALLRSPNAMDRGRALDELYAGSLGAVMLVASAESVMTSSTQSMDAGRMFNAVMALNQQLGTYLGLDLQWVRQQPDPDAIVVPRGV